MRVVRAGGAGEILVFAEVAQLALRFLGVFLGPLIWVP